MLPKSVDNLLFQPHFLFILTPPYSGSTLLAKILVTSRKIGLLTDNGEGQRIVPGMFEEGRWNPEKIIDYDIVKNIWLVKFQEQLARGKDIQVIVEKSPPNMVRIEKLIKLFDNVSLLANIRNPYAFCSIVFHRRYFNEYTLNRQLIMEGLGKTWIEISSVLRERILQYKIPLLHYEKYCENPELIVESLDLPEAVIKNIDVNKKIVVKDYPAQTIVDQNRKQIAKLSDKDIATIKKVLEKNAEIVDFFDYQIDVPI